MANGLEQRCQVPLLTSRPLSANLDSMGRPLGAAQGGLVYHTLNRANARLTIFEGDGDFAGFNGSWLTRWTGTQCGCWPIA